MKIELKTVTIRELVEGYNKSARPESAPYRYGRWLVGRTLRVRRNHSATAFRFGGVAARPESAPYRRMVCYNTRMDSFPVRKPMGHRAPLSVDVRGAVYFITIVAAKRGASALTDRAETILAATRHYQTEAKWFLRLFLIMPDHIHMLVSVPSSRTLADVVGHWKSYLTTQCGIRFQANFFDTRIRDEAHYREKWNYICRNPVARGLVATPREWPHSIAFDPASGEERTHR